MKTALYTGLRFLEDAAKGESVTKHLLRLRKLKRADPEYIREYQFKAMKRLISSAYENSSFYRKRFDDQGVHPEDVKSFEDFTFLNPVTREDIQNHSAELISKKINKDSLLSGHSSGSTGEPIVYYHDKQTLSAGRAAVLAGWELAGKKLGDKVITLWGNRETIEQEWSKPGSRLKAKLYRDRRFPVDKFIDGPYFQEMLEAFLKQKGGFIFGYAHPIYMIACYAKEKNIAFEPKFDGVLTTAEKLHSYRRSMIEEVLGPAYDGYGSREILGKAYQCRRRKGYHIIEPNIIFEAEDFKEDTKEVIVTDLWNYAWPLIRYKIGDLIAGEFGTCDCGCTWKTFDTVVGRVNELFVLPGGGIISPQFWVVSDLMKHLFSVKQLQFAKIGENKFVFRMKLLEGQDASFLDGFREAAKKHFRGIAEVDAELVDQIPIGPSGKHRDVVDETK